MLYYYTKKDYKPFSPPDNISIMPPVNFLGDENEELLPVEPELLSFTAQAKARFITGDLDIEKDWDKYVSDLETLGLSEAIELYQKAYDRQYK